MFTVNLLQQAEQAKMVPEFDFATQAMVGKKDDFLFNMFITHPDTVKRIENLDRIERGMQK